MSTYFQSTPTNLSQSSRQLSPGREQWALINQYKALQYQKIKQKQKQIAQQKKNIFRRQLDNQMNSKNNVQLQQIQADRKYYQFITNQSNKFKQRQQRQKYQKYIKRRQIQQQNTRLLDISRNSRLKQTQSGYNLQIGHKSQLQRKKNSQAIKKTVLDTLDQQLKHKQQQKYKMKLLQQENDIKNLQYQYQKYQNRPQPQRNFMQNQKVYQYYKELDHIKRIKDRQLQQKIVDEAAERKRQQDEQRVRNQQYKNKFIKQTIKQTLDQQVKQHNLKKSQQSKINPQQYSYGIISNIFREKSASYDKAKYIQQLRHQAQQQKLKKQKQKYMSEQQYKLNMNQLNKVVNGEYFHNSYVDRSMGTIGDNKMLRLGDIKDAIYNQDAEAVKNKLEMLRARNRSNSGVNDRDTRTERSF